MQPQLLQAPEAEDGDGDLLHLFDRYKLAVAMADRVNARRRQPKTFFLALNTGLLKDCKRYLPLTHLDNWRPRLFGPLDRLLLLAARIGGQAPVAPRG